MDDLQLIMEMFEYRRPMGSRTEDKFINRYLAPLGFKRDDFKNLVLTIGESPRVLFSSHVDTVHRTEGKQVLHYDPKTGILGTFDKNSSCLGADDTAGIWLMLEMIKAQIPGVYIIHHGEENGCIGSGDLARGNPAFFDNIDIAIAFDRMGYKDVITYQVGSRCASDAFAQSLADELALDYSPSPNGVVTDTAEYMDLVAECTNISVGYYHQHSSSETQDVPFLISLRDALLKVKWDNLVVQRDPSVQEYKTRSYFGGMMDYGFGFGSGYSPKKTSDELEDWICDYPDVAASMLRAAGFTMHEFRQEVDAQHGYDFSRTA